MEIIIKHKWIEHILGVSDILESNIDINKFKKSITIRLKRQIKQNLHDRINNTKSIELLFNKKKWT